MRTLPAETAVATSDSMEMKPVGDLYERDFHGWAYEQAAMLRIGKLSEADIGNIAEEIESMGRGERDRLTNRLAVLLAHLLKRRLQPGLRGNRWRLTIREQRRRTDRVLSQNPSLRRHLGSIMAEAFGDAVLINACVLFASGMPDG